MPTGAGVAPGGPEAGAARTVEVLPDSSGIDRSFHYTVPASLGPVPVGSIVRVPLHGRRLRGWVVAAGTAAPEGVRPVPILALVSAGPAPPIVELCQWAAWRFAGRLRPLLAAASPPVLVRPAQRPAISPRPGVAVEDKLPGVALDHKLPGVATEGRRAAQPTGSELRADSVPAAVSACLDAGDAVLRLPPSLPRLDVVLEVISRVGAERDGHRVLVLAESRSDAETLVDRLASRGLKAALQPEDWALAAGGGSGAPSVVVGTRNAVLAPGGCSAIVVLDAHSESYKSARVPAFDARVIAAERARREGAPACFVSSCPGVELTSGRAIVTLVPVQERAGWPRLVTLDVRQEDPRDAGYPPALLALVRQAVADGRGRPVVLVLNRKGRARLLACAACRSIQRCERCASALVQPERARRGEVGTLACPRCGWTGQALCNECGSARLSILRPGANRAVEEVAAVLGVDVGDVDAATASLPDTPVLVGTEAVLHRVRSAAMVGFLDFDIELMAARFRASERALVLLARGARLVGGRARPGRVVVRTSAPDHPVIRAAEQGDPGLASGEEARRRSMLSLPPFSSLAVVEGEGAQSLVDALPAGIEAAPGKRGGFLLRAASAAQLADGLAGIVAQQPAGWAGAGVRVEVDPADV
ncbi:MAG: hypothetical protein ACRD0Z_05740 [Acidimicrobiales bacterium]